MWPLAVCPYTLILLVGSLVPGHSASIRKIIEGGDGGASPTRPAAQPAPDASWQLWHRDVFDRECPANIDAEGEDLLAGLQALWTSYLRSGVQPGGSETFSRFHLIWRGGPVPSPHRRPLRHALPPGR
jgi:hypothetical protein